MGELEGHWVRLHPRHTWPPPLLFFQDALGIKWARDPVTQLALLTSTSLAHGGAQIMNMVTEYSG